MLFAEQWQTPASSQRPKEDFHIPIRTVSQFLFLFLRKATASTEQIPEVCPSATQPAVQAQLPKVHLDIVHVALHDENVAQLIFEHFQCNVDLLALPEPGP